jgi:hypothetical protein
MGDTSWGKFAYSTSRAIAPCRRPGFSDAISGRRLGSAVHRLVPASDAGVQLSGEGPCASSEPKSVQADAICCGGESEWPRDAAHPDVDEAGFTERSARLMRLMRWVHLWKRDPA